jgi:hypothetical protein
MRCNIHTADDQGELPRLWVMSGLLTETDEETHDRLVPNEVSQRGLDAKYQFQGNGEVIDSGHSRKKPNGRNQWCLWLESTFCKDI